MPGTATQQAFISQVAPGAVAAQQRYGIPASVTIAQAIDESGWGKASSPRRTTTCSESRAPARPAATCGRRRNTRTASGLPAPPRSGCTTTSRRASRTTAAPGHEPGIPARHGQSPGARRVRRRPHRRLRHRSELRLQPDRADAAVQPVPLRLSDGDRVPAGRGPGAHGGGPVGGGGGAGRLSFGGLGWRGLGQGGLRRRDLGRSRGHGRSWRGEHSRGGGRSGRRGGEGAAGRDGRSGGGSRGTVRDAEGTTGRVPATRRAPEARLGRRRGSGRGRGSRPGVPG